MQLKYCLIKFLICWVYSCNSNFQKTAYLHHAATGLLHQYVVFGCYWFGQIGFAQHFPQIYFDGSAQR
jgi:hypothetical protein